MTIKRYTSLLLVALLLLIVIGTLSVSHQVNTLSYLKREYSDVESQISDLMKEWEALAFERWMLRDLGTYPHNASPLEWTGGVKALIYYSNDVSEENLTRFDQLAESFNITITYLELANHTNLNKLKDMCKKTGFAEPSSSQSYLIVLNSSKIICLWLEQVDNKVFSKCIEYLSLSVP